MLAIRLANTMTDRLSTWLRQGTQSAPVSAPGTRPNSIPASVPASMDGDGHATPVAAGNISPISHVSVAGDGVGEALSEGASSG
jgi:hypothetical protein